MKIFIVLCESPLKILKIAVYRCLISFLAPELLMFKDLQNGLKNGTKNARSGIKSVTSCDGHLIPNNPYIYYVPANTCVNH